MLLRSAVFALVLLSALPAAAAGIEERLAPTPLVLKDGRVARVSVHVIPFPVGNDRPNAAMQEQLDLLVDALATDCFLTAQAVGHVEPGPGNDGDTLVAHRLARARADRIQAALVERGLPASSIASVWDWQFSVREPRVTLWAFRLAEGDDCDNQPIARTPAVATAQPEPAPTAAAAPAGEPEPVTAEAATAGEPEPVAEAAAPPASPAVVEPPAAAVEPVVSETPAEAPPAQPETAAAEPLESLAAPESETVIAESAAGNDLPAAPADESTMAITFDINSSYLPKGTSRELKALIAPMRGDQSYEIRLDGAVSSEHLRQPTSDNGLAYNRWIAERRLSRVADWLRQHVNGGAIDIKQGFVENDESRRVTIRIRPLP